jgi:hypothetical protein
MKLFPPMVLQFDRTHRIADISDVTETTCAVN